MLISCPTKGHLPQNDITIEFWTFTSGHAPRIPSRGHAELQNHTAEDADDTLPIDIEELPTPEPPPKRVLSNEDVTSKRRKYQNLPSFNIDDYKPAPKGDSPSAEPTSCTSKPNLPAASVESLGEDAKPAAPTRRVRKKAPSSSFEDLPQDSEPHGDTKEAKATPKVLHAGNT